MKPLTTEQWLHEAWRRLTPTVEGAIAEALPDVAEHYAAPANIQLAVGYFPKISKKEQPWGYCADPTEHHDGETYTVFVAPDLAGNPRRTSLTLAVIGHEMIHAWLTNEHGHNRRFQKVAHAMGFRRPYKDVDLSYVSPKLLREFRRIGRILGPCPWKTLKPEA